MGNLNERSMKDVRPLALKKMAEKKKITARLREKFQKEIAPSLMKELDIANPMAVPRLHKIVINMGVGEATQNPKVMDPAVNELMQIAGQRPVVTRAKKSIAAFKVREGDRGYFEREAGYLKPEACISGELALARRHGAELRLNERVLCFEERASEVVAETETGSIAADRLLVCAGPWLGELLPERLARVFRIYRQVLFWFDIQAEYARFAPHAFPVFIREVGDAAQGIYGFPAIDGPTGGVKIATESYAATVSPETAERSVGSGETRSMYREHVANNLNGVSPTCVKWAVCFYTVTPDFGFVVDWLSPSRRVLIVSACSGHGFKHGPSVGEYLAGRIAGNVPAEPRFDFASKETTQRRSVY